MTTAMRQWEYAVIRLEQFEMVPPGEWVMAEPGARVNAEEQLEEFGREGWELVGVELPYAFLKRPN